MLFFKHFLGEIDTQIFVLVLQNSASMSGLKYLHEVSSLMSFNKATFI